jgi:hypothetical protein
MVGSMSSKFSYYGIKLFKRLNEVGFPKSDFFNRDKALPSVNDSFFNTRSMSMVKPPSITHNRYFNSVSLNQSYDLKREQQQVIAKYLHCDPSKLGNSSLKTSLAPNMEMTLSSSEKTQTFRGLKKVLEFFQQHLCEINKLRPDLSPGRPSLTVEGVFVNKNNKQEKHSFTNVLHFNLYNQVVSIQSQFSKLP